MDPATILVTGGGRGIGAAIVRRLAGDGFRVAFTHRDAHAGARELEAACAGAAKGFVLDLRDRLRPAALVEEVESALGPIRGLVNNAGIRKDALLAMTPDGDWDDVLDVNLGGAFRCCRAVLPRMIAARRGGSIVNVASLTALHGVSGQTAYGAAKAGLIGMTRSLAREVGRREIRVNAVVPGFVATEMVSALAPEVVSALRATECLPRGTSPDDVAGVVAWLLSDRAAAVTGQVVVVDAGSSA